MGRHASRPLLMPLWSTYDRGSRLLSIRVKALLQCLYLEFYLDFVFKTLNQIFLLIFYFQHKQLKYTKIHRVFFHKFHDSSVNLQKMCITQEFLKVRVWSPCCDGLHVIIIYCAKLMLLGGGKGGCVVNDIYLNPKENDVNM